MTKKSVFAAIFLAVTLVVMSTITAFAWSNPTVTPLCAPDSTHFAFKVTLSNESNYNMQWSWSQYFTSYTAITLAKGDNTVTIPRGTHSNNDRWYIRYASDHNAVGNAKANGTLCPQSHTVTWAINADCTGWNATYSIDGATPVVYDSGIWSDPYALETASPDKSFTVPEVPGDIYDHPKSPNVTVNEPVECLKQHVEVTLCHATPPATAANGWNSITIDDDAVVKQGHDNHAMDIIPAFTYWDKDGQHSYPGKNLSTIFGWGVTGQQVLDNGCAIPTQPVHQVTWATNVDCTGWNATYAIDGGTPVVYDSGIWSNLFLLETANPKAFTVPEVPGDLYDHPNAPSVTVNEPSSCQVYHRVTWATHANCQGWNATYAIDGGTPVVYDTAPWANPFVLETANPKAFTVPENSGQLYDVPNAPSVTVNEPAECLVVLDHNAVINVANGCTGWSASFSSSDGGIGTPTTPVSGTWVDPYTLENATVSYHVVWSDGYSINIGRVINEPETCLIHQVAGVEFVKKGCGPNGSTYTFTFPTAGVEKVVLTKGLNTITLTGSGDVTLGGGTWNGQVFASDGYDIVPSENALFTVNSDVCPSYVEPKPVGLTLWVYTDYRLGFNVTPGNFGPDGGCFIYGIGVIPTSPSVGIPYCDGGPFLGNNAYIKVYTGWVTLPAPGTQQCWGPRLANGCEGDLALAELNAKMGWHLTYRWFFPGYGGH